jgi:hypothetical protein
MSLRERITEFAQAVAYDVRTLLFRFNALEVHVSDFGAVPGGVVDDSDAIEAAIAEVQNTASGKRKVLRFGPSHRITRSIDFTNTGGVRYEVRGGDNIDATQIIVDYNGYGTGAKVGAAFQFGNPASPAYQTAVGINGFLFKRGPNCDRPPIGIQAASMAQSRVKNITFGGWDNITLSLLTPQNVRMDTFTTFGGGYTFPPRDASGVTVTQSGNVLSASSSIFSNTDDPGRTVAIWGTSGSSYRRKAKIVSYTSLQTVVVDDVVNDATPRRIIFGSPGVSTNAGGFNLTADYPCFTPEHKGLVVYIKGAGVNGGLHRAVLTTYTNSSVFTISPAAVTAVSKAEFCVPAVEIYSDPDFGNGASDVQITKLQIEGHKGVGLCVYDVDILHIQGKIHAEQTITNPQDASLAAFWADRWAGSFVGDFDGQYVGESRSYVTNLTKSLHIPSLHSRIAYNDTMMLVGPYFPEYEGAMVVFGNLAFSGGSSTETIGSGLLRETSPGYGYTIHGVVTQAEYDKTLAYLTRQVTATDDGDLNAKSIKLTASDPFKYYKEATSFTVEVSDAATGGNLASGTFDGTYSLIGNRMRVTMRLLNINTAGMTAGNTLYIRGMPHGIKGGTANFALGNVRMNSVASTELMTHPFMDDGDKFITLYETRDGATSVTIKVADLTSGSASMWLDISYDASDANLP